MPFKNITEVKETNKSNGLHFFDRDTMRFFSCRIESRLIANEYFITSEQNKIFCNSGTNYPRLFTIRKALKNGQIETIGEFQQYKSKQLALDEIQRLIKER